MLAVVNRLLGNAVKYAGASFPPSSPQFPLPVGLRCLALSFSYTLKESLFTGYTMLQLRSQVLSPTLGTR